MFIEKWQKYFSYYQIYTFLVLLFVVWMFESGIDIACLFSIQPFSGSNIELLFDKINQSCVKNEYSLSAWASAQPAKSAVMVWRKPECNTMCYQTWWLVFSRCTSFCWFWHAGQICKCFICWYNHGLINCFDLALLWENLLWTANGQNLICPLSNDGTKICLFFRTV